MLVKKEMFFILIFFLSAINAQLRKPVDVTRTAKEFFYEGVVIGEDQKYDRIRLKLAIKAIITSNDTIPLGLYAEYNTDEPDNYLGKTITIRGRLKIAKNSHRPNTIVGKIVEKDYRHSYAGRLFNTVSGCINDLLRRSFDSKYSSIAQGLILGGSSRLDEELRRVFARAGVLHILAVSGLHIGFIIAFLGTIVLPLPIAPRLKFLIIMLILILYAGITGFRPSVLRATLMAFLFGLSLLLQRQVDSVHIVNISALILLLVNPIMLFDIGAQLSFGAVYGIVFLLPKINDLVLKKIRNRFLKPVLWSMATSLSAQVFVSPFLIQYFNQLPTLAVFSNLLIVPLAAVIIYLLFMMIIVSFISAHIVGFIAITVTKLIWILASIAGFFAHLPFSAVSVRLSPIFMVIFFFIFFQRTRKIAIFAICIVAIFYSAVSLVPASLIKMTNNSALIILSNKEKILICDRKARGFYSHFDEDMVDYLVAQKRIVPVVKEFIPLPQTLFYKRLKLNDFIVHIENETSVQWGVHKFVIPRDGYENHIAYIICARDRVRQFIAPLEPSVLDQLVTDLRLHFELLKIAL